MTYEPQYLDASEATIEIVIRSDGKAYREYRVLGDAWHRATGPMSMESACIGAIRRVIERVITGESQGIGLGEK